MIPIIDREETGKKLKKYMLQKGITVKEIQEYLELGSVQSIYHWLNGSSMPTIDNLYALSELFQIPIDDMICGNRQIRFYVNGDGFNKRTQLYYDYLILNKVA